MNLDFKLLLGDLTSLTGNVAIFNAKNSIPKARIALIPQETPYCVFEITHVVKITHNNNGATTNEVLDVDMSTNPPPNDKISCLPKRLLKADFKGENIANVIKFLNKEETNMIVESEVEPLSGYYGATNPPWSIIKWSTTL